MGIKVKNSNTAIYTWKWKWKSLSFVWLSHPIDCIVHGILQARILESVAFPFSRGSFQPRNRTQVFHIAGGFFTSWATREAQESWSESPVLSAANLPDPGIEPGSPALQVDSLTAELPGNWKFKEVESGNQVSHY